MPASAFIRRALSLGAAATALTSCSDGANAGPKPAPATVKASAPALRWASFTDPAERAFTMDVPAGWQVAGGTRRMSAVEIRTGVTVRSPDGSMELFVGDLSVPAFAMPHPMLQMAGFPEGSTYSPGYGQSFLVASYQSGAGFASNWGARRIASACRGAQAGGARPLPQASRAIGGVFAQYGVATSIDAGEASFTCSWNGAPGAGYVFAATERVAMNGAGIWNVKTLAGYAARADRADEAQRLLGRMVGSFRVNPQWAGMQQGLTGNASQIVAGTNAAVSRSIVEAGQFRQASSDRNAQGFAEATRGTATYDDPVEGRRELANRAHWWRLPNGNTVATDTATPPAVGAVELRQVPRGR